MTRLERRNRTDIQYAGYGSLFDALDDAIKQGWRITDEEYDYLLSLDLDAEKYLIIDENSTYREKKDSISFVNKNLKRYE